MQNDLVDAAVPLLYEAVLDPSRWVDALGACAAVFDAPRACTWQMDVRACSITEFRQHGYTMEVQRQYIDHYCAVDPGWLAASRARAGQWLYDEMLLDPRVPDQQEYAFDFARPNGIGRVAGGAVELDASGMGLWFSVQRPLDRGPFGTRYARRFERLLPHLQQAAKMEARMKQLAHTQAIAQAALDALKAAVCMVDATRRAHLLNGLAERMLGGAELLQLRGGRLVYLHTALDERLAALVTNACSRVPRGGLLQLRRKDGATPLQVMVLPVPQTHRTAALIAQPLALVIAMDPQQPHLAREAYQELFGLTDTEAAVLFCLANGSSLAQWAGERGVSMSTARTHLASVFAKTGVDTQARLLRLARTLPAMQ